MKAILEWGILKGKVDAPEGYIRPRIDVAILGLPQGKRLIFEFVEKVGRTLYYKFEKME